MTSEEAVSARRISLQEELSRYVTVLSQATETERVILFGSLAKNNVHAWSDLDIIIIQRTTLPFLRRLHEVRRLLHPKIATDFFVYTQEEFDNLCKEKRFFDQEILSHGKILYDRNGATMAGIRS